MLQVVPTPIPIPIPLYTPEEILYYRSILPPSHLHHPSTWILDPRTGLTWNPFDQDWYPLPDYVPLDDYYDQYYDWL